VVKTFPGQKKLIPGNAVQLLLNHGQYVKKKKSKHFESARDISQYFRI